MSTAPQSHARQRPPFLLLGGALLLVLAVVAVWLGWGSGPSPATGPAANGGDATVPPNGPPVATGDAPVTEPATAEAPAAGQRSEVAPTPAVVDTAQGVLGIVVDRFDQPFAGAQLFLVESLQNDPLARLRDVPVPPVAAATSAADGSFRLGLREAAGLTYDVHVLAPGHADERVSGIRVLPDQWHDLGTVRLFAGTAIRGVVRIAGTALPVPHAVVTLERGDPLSDVGARDLPGFRATRVATSDAAGIYELPNAPRRGIHRLTAVAPGFARAIRDGIELGERPTLQIDFDLLPGLSIGGQVLAADGSPVAGARIEAWPKTAEPAHQTTSRADGVFALDGLVEGGYRIRVLADGFRTKDVPQIPAGTAGLLVRLEPRGEARVIVRAPDGTVLRQYRLAVRRWFESDGGQIGIVRDVPDRTVRLAATEDAATVGGLDPVGSYAFQVEANGFARTISRPFTLEESSPVEMTMARGGTLRGTVVDGRGAPLAGATVATGLDGADPDNPMWRMLQSLAPERITKTTATTDAAGTFTLTGLAHGNYQLLVSHPEACDTVRRGVAITRDDERTLPPIALPRGALVRGRAFVDGVPQGQVQVVLTPAPEPGHNGDEPGKSRDETRQLRVEAISGQDGSFALPRRIPPGRYELRGALQIGTEPQADVFRQLEQMQRSATPVTVAAGQESLDQDLRITTAR